MRPASLRRNAPGDEYEPLLDAIEEERADVIVPLFEQLLGGPPTALRLYELAVVALGKGRREQAEALFKDGRKTDRWALLPLELQTFVPWEHKVVREEIAHTFKIPKRDIGLVEPWGVGAFVFRDKNGIGMGGAEVGNHRWYAFKNANVARDRALAASIRWMTRDELQQVVPDRYGPRGRATQSRAQIKKRAEEYLNRASLGELLGIGGTWRDGRETASGFIVFDDQI